MSAERETGGILVGAFVVLTCIFVPCATCLLWSGMYEYSQYKQLELLVTSRPTISSELVERERSSYRSSPTTAAECIAQFRRDALENMYVR